MAISCDNGVAKLVLGGEIRIKCVSRGQGVQIVLAVPDSIRGVYARLQ
jgi:hypothetical protein